MAVSASVTNIQKLGADTVAQVESFAKEHPELVKTTGLVTAAVLIGGTGGFLLAKGALVAKGAAVAKASSAAPVLATQGTVGTTATIQNAATLLNNSIAGGSALVDKVTALFNTISTNAVPLTAGVVGGGAAGVGATRYQVSQVKDELAEQTAQTAAARAENSRLATALTAVQSTLSELQSKLAPQTTAPAVQERLEQIKGIGRVFAQKLNAAGIYTLADLAAQTPERLRDIIGTNRAGSMTQPADWIQQARQLLNPEQVVGAAPAAPVTAATEEASTTLQFDRLEAISGITPALAARLNQAGILTYTDLAGQTPAKLQALLGTEPSIPERTLADWIVAARALATQ
ncbi:MAG: helix-hairpin-helix domain-containing protein [Caldilineaceae bacterium]